MIPDDAEWSEACKNLEKFLAETRSKKAGEMIELLRDMHRDGVLAFRQDTRNEFSTPLWYPLNPDVYADRIFTIEDDFAALLAELFLVGKIEFATRTVPPLTVEWYAKGKQPSAPPVM